MTAWHRNEYILKGVFLGLWVFFALQVPADPTAVWIDIAWVARLDLRRARARV